MARLEKLHSISLKLLHVLEHREENDRETTLQKIDQLIEQRDRIIETIAAPYTTEEEEIGKKVLQLNEKIMNEMDQLYSNVKEDMKQVKKQKELNRSYINPYGQIKTTDGMYVDRKQ